MCGLTGKIYFEQNRPVDPVELKRMTDVISHRGPDDEGSYIKDNVGLGFRRLSIIDIKGGHQPLSNADGTIWITFNGEIYNFRELRANLLKKGQKFKTNSDTEVIVNLYEIYGDKCVEYLRGMFAFVIWDERKRQIFGARDRFGIKPFFYYIDDEQFVYGSEIKSIRCAIPTKNSINLESVDDYFTYGYSTTSKTMYTGILKLPSACKFILNPMDKKLIIEKYWQPEFKPDYFKDENYWIHKIQETLKESIRLRLISDVPLGAFLSGGIDSGSVVALMSQISTKPVKTFSIGFKEHEYDELYYARLLARKYNTEHHELILEPDSISLLPKLVSSYDEPFADSSAIPTYYVSKFAREHVTVTLSGDGGDELFAGYNSYNKMMHFNKLFFNNHFTNKYVFSYLNKIIPEYFYGKGYTYYLSKPKKKLGAYYCFWKDYERQNLYNADMRFKLQGYRGESIKIKLLDNSNYDYLSKLQNMDLNTYLIDDILVKVDRASMMNSLESRIPIIDHHLAELSFKIPPELKIKNGDRKYIFKKAMAPFLPTEILNHKKQGFAVPLKSWFKADLFEYTQEIFTNKSSDLYDYLDYNYVLSLFNNHQKGYRDFSSKIWSLLFFNEWLIQNI